jgi:hypothetical protein
VDLAYDILDVDGSGQVDMADIKTAYNTDESEEVKAGTKTSDEVFAEFAASLGDKDHDGIITKDEWCVGWQEVTGSGRRGWRNVVGRSCEEVWDGLGGGPWVCAQ